MLRSNKYFLRPGISRLGLFDSHGQRVKKSQRGGRFYADQRTRYIARGSRRCLRAWSGILARLLQRPSMGDRGQGVITALPPYDLSSSRRDSSPNVGSFAFSRDAFDSRECSPIRVFVDASSPQSPSLMCSQQFTMDATNVGYFRVFTVQSSMCHGSVGPYLENPSR